MSKSKFKFLAAVLGLVLITSCVKEYDNPPIDTIPTGSLVTIDSLRSLFADSGAVSFKEDVSFYATVTADEVNGNLYKEVYVQDGTGAIKLNLLNSGGLYRGDQIRVNLNGTIMLEDNDFLIIDSVDVDLNVVKQKTKQEVEPLEVSIAQLHDSLQGYLIKLEDVQFNYQEFGKTYADAIGKQTVNLMLEDCNGIQVIVRNSGYANFADQEIPFGKGDFVAVLGQYRNDLQLFIRDINEVKLDGDRCPGTNVQLFKGFDDESVTSGGWQNLTVSGNVPWGIFSGSNSAAKITNFNNGSNSACESWLISPKVSLENVTAPILNFRNTHRYSGPQLDLLISTDYVSGDPSSATWTELNPIWDTDDSSWSWVDSGDLDLSSYVGQSNVHIAFKYTGSNSDGSTWEVDEILIAE
ncbi:MAG: DUF5689 domain-containing protein [Flavobacteriales bacterium]|nr:DUF5689 domain-containing protein [Flavobacteriales bacterium]